MPNDAKLGLVAGVGLVLAIGVVFFHKDPPAAPTVPPAAQRPAPAKSASTGDASSTALDPKDNPAGDETPATAKR
jgi:hypothetical protein